MRECAACGAEVARLEGALQRLGGAVREWSATQPGAQSPGEWQADRAAPPAVIGKVEPQYTEMAPGRSVHRRSTIRSSTARAIYWDPGPRVSALPPWLK